ncbi:MAG: signal recognition particle protein [Pseudomonadota bacterium]
MFQSLQDTFRKTFDRLAGRGKLTESDVKAASREIKLALLAADVHYGVVKDFVDAVAARAVGREVLESITPAQQYTKIVYDELVRVLGAESAAFDFACEPPLIVLIVGLQGSGKTTSAAKFALHCKKAGRRPFLVPADVHRPAAIDQLMTLAKEANVDCWPTEKASGAVDAAKAALAHAKKIGYDTIIIDTAGRLHVDREMMEEAIAISGEVKPKRILYVADAMTGQDAVKSAKAFDEALAITGIVLAKMDGDARGGAAFSVKSVTGKPIIFVGSGERLDDLETFHPERMASRILGLGDVISLAQRVAESVEGEGEEMGRAMSSGRFTLDDFIKQIRMMRKLGPMDRILGLIPGMGGITKDLNPEDLEREMRRKEAIICSMTREEKSNPRVLNGSRRKRIAMGAGRTVSDVNRFLKEFETMGKMMKKFSGRGALRGLFKGLTKQTFS